VETITRLSPEVEGGLEDRGLEAVRMLLEMAGPAPDSGVYGLRVRGGATLITRGDAEQWIRRKNAERFNPTAYHEAFWHRRETIRFWSIAATIAIVALATAVAALMVWPRSLGAGP
jgi:hypothetical protein